MPLPGKAPHPTPLSVQRYPKEYEWSAAFGLVFTVIWIYLKILDLLMEFAGKKDD